MALCNRSGTWVMARARAFQFQSVFFALLQGDLGKVKYLEPAGAKTNSEVKNMHIFVCGICLGIHIEVFENSLRR